MKINYSEAYNIIISLAKLEGLDKSKVDGYREYHHILPKCMGGGDEPDNLVLLTAREHYICHFLLVEIYKTSEHLSSLICAFRFMSVDNNYQRVSSTDFSYMRELYSTHHPMKNKNISSKVSNSLKKYYSEMTDEQRIEHSNRTKLGITQDVREFLSLKAKTQMENMTEEQFLERNKKISESLLLFYNTHPENKNQMTNILTQRYLECPELKEKISNSLKKHYENETTEERILRIEILKSTTLSPESNKKRGETLSNNLKLLSEDDMNARLDNSLRTCDNVARGKSISKSKKGKPTNQQEIMGLKYSNMSDVDFEKYLHGRSKNVISRMIKLRERYHNGI